jgi:hypothetical protein
MLLSVRFLAALLLGLFLAQATGLAAALEGECEDACTDDDPGEECPPICPSCTCLTHTQPSLVLRADAPLIAGAPVLIDVPGPATLLPSPDPREILHVPKSLLG